MATATPRTRTRKPKVAAEISGDTAKPYVGKPGLFQRLSAKFELSEVKQRVGSGGRQLDYISIDTVLNRLNAVLELGWEFEGVATHLSTTPVSVKGQEKDGWLAVVTGHLTVHTEDGPRKTFGVGAHRDVDPDMAIKSALAEAEKKAAQRRGVGLYLWDEEAREELAEQRKAIAQKEAEPKSIEDMTLDELKLSVYELAVTQGLTDHSATGVATWFDLSEEALEFPGQLKDILGQYA